MRPLTTADVARRPPPGRSTPTNIAFSPDGSVVTFLLAEAGSLRQRLHVCDVSSGVVRALPTPGEEVDEAALSLEERLRRERSRDLAIGVTRYAWASRAHRLLVPMADGLWCFDDLDEPPRRVLAAERIDGGILDPQISADGSTIGFVASDEVWTVPAAGGEPVQVTAGARGTGRTNGLAEYIAQEEMGRPYGFWLSPDGAEVAFCEVDETHLPRYRIVHQGSDDPADHEEHRYPFAGCANARVRLGVVAGDGSTADRPQWLDLASSGLPDDRYLARVAWHDDALVVQVEDRTQRRLDLIRFAMPDGSASTLLSETSDVWINLHDGLRPLGPDRFLWASERSGFRHLEVRTGDGDLVHELTGGDWVVTQVNGTSDTAVFFTATEASPTERHLYEVPLDGSAPPRRLTDGRGVHAVCVHAATGAWVDVHSDETRPAITTLHRADGTASVIHDAGEDPGVAEIALRPPTLRTVVAADGTTPLHAAVFAPDGDGPFPTILWVYGGPHAQLVEESWALTTAMRAQYLRQEGFCVAVVDNRGMANRGLAFEGALRHRMGTIEVDDQCRLVGALVADRLTDPDRVGIYGWSYGGYLSAMCLARRPDVFRAACAGAPVTSWDGYDTHYTERYMGTPADNPDGYRDGSVMHHIEGLRDRRLLLVHGLIDENVHFRHTARLVQALVRADIDHELRLYPDERHVPRHEADRVSMERRIADFFADALR